MKNIILLIFTPDDLAFLPEAVKRLRTMAIEFLWILHTPQLGLPYPASATALDQEIIECERDKQRAVLAENFDDATKFRNQAGELAVRRELEIKNAYKAIPHAQILEIYDRTFAELNEETTGIPNIIREALPDPIAPSGALAYLASRGTDWYDQFPHGEYGILWIRALPEIKDGVQTNVDREGIRNLLGLPNSIDYKSPTPAISNPPDLDARQELINLPYRELLAAASEAGVKTHGKKKDVLADEILAARELLTV